MGDVYAPNGLLVVQCKTGKRPPIWQALAEAEEAAHYRGAERPGHLCLAIAAIHRDAPSPGHHSNDAIVMSPETFSFLYSSVLNPDPEGW